jgi:hypothetical protein
MNKTERKVIKTPASNEQFSASGGVTPQKMLCENEHEIETQCFVSLRAN